MVMKVSKYYIKEWRLIRRLTQRTLAEKARVCRPTVVMMERGRVNPTEETLAAVAEALGVTLAQLAKDPFSRFAEK